MAVESASSLSSSKVQFAIGNEVSSHCHFFKSSFARSLVKNVRDCKSLDYELHNNNTTTIIEESSECNVDDKNNNYFSLLDFRTTTTTTTMSTTTTTTTNDTNSNNRTINNTETNNQIAICDDASSVPIDSDHQSNVNIDELERLRKECQSLKEDNKKLQNALTLNQVPHVQVIDNVFLQTQIETLHWQLKQIESNKQMYRSLMEEVARFLDRAHKSLIILHEKNNSKDNKSNNARVPRSRSVHAVDITDCSPNRGISTTSSSSSGSSSSSSSSSSRFTRAKSVNQISGGSAFREFTWSVLRRNQNTNLDNKQQQCDESFQDDKKTMTDDVSYMKPKQMELNPDDVPPEKLSQEAFRLMRTVQSLLSMREPDLSRVLSPYDDNGISPSPTNNHYHHHHHHHHHRHDSSSILQRDNLLNNSITHDESYGRCLDDSERRDRELIIGNESSSNCLDYQNQEDDDDNNCQSKLSSSSSNNNNTDVNRNNLMKHLLPGVRNSVDVSLYNSGTNCNNRSNKLIEDDERIVLNRDDNLEIRERNCNNNTNGIINNNIISSSTPLNKCTNKRVEKKVVGVNNNNGGGDAGGMNDLMVRTVRAKLATSVSSADDESGFSSMSSFQEVGLPTSPISPVIKGCHTEIGLPEIPIENVQHRRWSSTPNEIQTLIKRHSANNFPSNQTNNESMSVWV